MKKFRFWEIDSLRGVALSMMIIYHYIVSMNLFGNYNIDLYTFFWIVLQRIIVGLFLFLVGISLTLSFVHNRNREKPFHTFIVRGLKIFSWGMVITLVTWFILRDGYVVFGILHLIAVAGILAYPFLYLPARYSLFFAVPIIIIGSYLYKIRFDFSFLVWLGFIPEGFYSVDYAPVFPWFGVLLAGVFWGKVMYPQGVRRFSLPDYSDFPLFRLWSVMGRRSLFIYLVHQVVIVFAMLLLGLTDIAKIFGP